MASTNTALCYHLKDLGAIAPSYKANLVVLDDANSVAYMMCSIRENLLNEFLLGKRKKFLRNYYTLLI